MALTRDINIFMILPIQRGLSTFLFPRLSCHKCFHCISSKFPIIQPNHWPQPVHQYITAHLGISSSEKNKQSSALLKVAHWNGFSSPLSFRDVPEWGYRATAVHFSNGACILCRLICKPVLSVSFLFQVIIKNSPRGYGCRLGERR